MEELLFSGSLFKTSFTDKRVASWKNVSAACMAVFFLLTTPLPLAVEALILDQNCVVSILNRNIQAQSDGSFEMPNVPSNMGRIKATATCTRDGQTIGGETEYFTVVANEDVRVGDFFSSAGDTVPVGLTILNGNPMVFNDIGRTERLEVEARYNDGSTEVTTAGVNFTVSNPNVASVNSIGSLTTVSPGTALITVRKDGVVTVVTVVVSTSGDTDGDGINDDVELSLGLDPNDPVDAFEDRDMDRLSNLAELQLGTSIDNPDTDGDGIVDGEEVVAGDNGFVTSPLTPDTDGDGVSDGLELLAGTDPNDASDFDYGPLIVAVDVVPAELDVVINSVEGAKEIQFRATADLIDGSRVDVTRFSNFGPTGDGCGLTGQLGRINFNAAGTCEIRATAGVISGFANANVSIYTPTAISFLDLGVPVSNVAVTDNEALAYVADAQGLSIVDASNIETPVLLSTLPLNASATDVQIASDTTIYLAAPDLGLLAIDVSDPAAPQLLQTVPLSQRASDIALRDSLAAVALDSGSIKLYDISNERSPQLISTLDVGSLARGVAINDQATEAYVATEAGLVIADISAPDSPALIGSLLGGAVMDVASAGDFVYLADSARSMLAVDVSDPANPVAGAPLLPTEGGLLNDIEIRNGFAFGADFVFTNAVPIVSIDAAPVLAPRGLLDFSGLADAQGAGLDVTRDYVWLAAGKFLFIGSAFDACPDPDEDGLCPGDEVIYGTDPELADTDGDLLLDGYEVEVGLNPLDPEDAALADTDADGLTDVEEIINSLNPRSPDTDGDGLSDPDELNVFGTRGNDADTDGDLVSDFVEVALGLSPLDAADGDITPFVTALESRPGTITLGIANSANRVSVQVFATVDAGGTPLEVEVTDDTQFGTVYQTDNPSIATAAGRGRFDLLDTGTVQLASSFAGQNTSTTLLIEGLFDETFDGVGESWSGNRDYSSLSVINSTATGGSLTLSNNLLFDGATSTFNLDQLTVGGNIAISGDGANFNVDTITVAGNLIVDGGTLVLNTDSIVVGGQIQLINGATITGITLETLKLQATGVSVDAASRITMVARGYGNAGAPVGDPNPIARLACHGGNRWNATSDCTQGDYRRANLPGRGANRAGGGGVLEIVADSLNVDGLIDARGGGSDRGQGGAGGSVHLELGTLSGSGELDVSGGLPNSPTGAAGAGGRLSIVADDIAAFTGQYTVRSGANRVQSGAGTAYIKLRGESLGRLIVDNGGAVAPVSSTPLPSVGRHTIASATLVGQDEWQIQVSGTPWASYGPNPWQTPLVGTEVDLDATEDASELYIITAHSDNTLTVATSDDLSGIVGQDLIGVHRYADLKVLGGASLDLGDDRLLVTDASRFSQDDLSSIDAGDIHFANGLTLADTSIALGSSQPVRVSGDLVLNNVQVSAAGRILGEAAAMRFNVSGNFIVDAASSISVVAKGFSETAAPPGDPNPNGRRGCHGGLVRSATFNCAYGDYRRARLPGRGAQASTGGGVIEIVAGNLQLDGLLNAQGGGSGQFNQGSAGGAIHIETSVLSGGGTLNVRGGVPSSTLGVPGAGGRVSIYADDVASFSGQYVLGGPDNYSQQSGAGTAYIKLAAEELGRLTVDNGGRASLPGSTPIASVGQHEIVSATLIGLDEWQLQVAGAPWSEYGPEPWQMPLIGTEVDLNAAEDLSKLYVVAAHSDSTITVISSDDLTTTVGQTLTGVHRFSQLAVLGGASVSVGDDRVEIAAGEDLQIDGISSLVAGDIHIAGDVILQDTIAGLGSSAPVRVSGDLTLTSSSIVAAGEVLGADATMRLEVSGSLVVDAASSISVVGKGYGETGAPPGDPDVVSRQACHGGNRRSATSDCAHGDFRRASQPGRGARGARGGGVVEIIAGDVQIDGVIDARGSGTNFSQGSAGGAIHIETGTLSGSGVLDVGGGTPRFSAPNSPGAGGRISVYATDVSAFSGEYKLYVCCYGATAGAGTAYIKLTGETHGRLLVDNGGQTALSGSTPIASVGRHTITAVTFLGNDEWQIDVAGAPWAAFGAARWQMPLVGTYLDVDPDTPSDALPIINQTPSSLTVRSASDLSSTVGLEVIGVHLLERLTVTRGASLSVGQDRITVQDLDNSDTSSGSVVSDPGSTLP